MIYLLIQGDEKFQDFQEQAFRTQHILESVFILNKCTHALSILALCSFSLLEDSFFSLATRSFSA